MYVLQYTLRQGCFDGNRCSGTSGVAILNSVSPSPGNYSTCSVASTYWENVIILVKCDAYWEIKHTTTCP